MNASDNNYDVLIIGGGPTGTTTGALLAEQGHRVLIVERDKFPRYHVGESLIPFTFHPLERLGLIPKMKESHFVKKYSVTFVQPEGDRSQPFYFHTRYDADTVAQTWQVLRSEFDQMLLDHARSKGAEVWEEAAATKLLYQDTRVAGAEIRTKGDVCQVMAKTTVDCTGKEAWTSHMLGWRVGDPYLNKVAVWTYYKGSLREPGLAEGGTTVAFIPERGWFWHIPLHDDMVSVGVVAEGKYLTRGGVRDLKAIFDRAVLENVWIRDHLSVGRQVGEYYITSEYSKHSKYCASPGLVLAGDAFAFLDPVFSSGVLLAMKSGVLVADAIHDGLIKGDLSPGQFAEYSRAMREGLENMRKLIYAFYNPNFSFRDVVKRHPHLGGEITDCLSGEVNKDFSLLWEALKDIVDLPEPLPYGVPMQEPVLTPA